MRILLFLGTNFAILMLASITLNLLGVNSFLDASGTNLNLNNLLVFCAVFGFGGAFVSLFLSKWIAKRSMRATVIDEPKNGRETWLKNTVSELARQAKIGMPEVAIFPSEQANAFATGWNRNNALVAVSEGLLQRFDKDQIRAVLAHEVGHVANGDMVTLTLIQGVINTFVMFLSRLVGHFVDRVLLKNQHGHGLGFYATVIVTEIILALLASIIVMWFSRQREFRADATGAQLAGRQAMISALEGLKREYGKPSELADGIQAFGISGSWRRGLGALFASHPPLEKRINALQQQV